MKTLVLLALALGSVACRAEKPKTQPCECVVRVESAWCGPAEQQKAKIEALHRDPLACGGPTGSVIDLDVSYVVEGCRPR
jgi:hypothetical protein